MKLDLRKTHPLGPEVEAQRSRCALLYSDAKRLGPGDQSKIGWNDHHREFMRLRDEARRLHSLLIVISDLVGSDVTAKIKALAWAATHDFNGDPK